MTHDGIIRMAREAGVIEGFDSVHPSIERFFHAAYAAGAAAEREACAGVCDEAHELMNSSFQGAAAAIRARGNT